MRLRIFIFQKFGGGGGIPRCELHTLGIRTSRPPFRNSGSGPGRFGVKDNAYTLLYPCFSKKCKVCHNCECSNAWLRWTCSEPEKVLDDFNRQSRRSTHTPVLTERLAWYGGGYDIQESNLYRIKPCMKKHLASYLFWVAKHFVTFAQI